MMGMNFTGQHKRTKNINLGGRNSGSASKENILRRAQLDRERREKVRREEKAATVIQAFFRARIDVIEARKRFEEEWNSIFVNPKFFQRQSDDVEMTDSSVGSSETLGRLTTEALTKCILQFTYFFIHTNTTSELSEVQARSILQILQSNVEEFRLGHIEKSIVSGLSRALSSVLEKRNGSNGRPEPLPIDSVILNALELLQEFSDTALLPTCSRYIESVTAGYESDFPSQSYYETYPQALVIRDTLLNIISHQLENNGRYTDFLTELLATPGLHIIVEKEALQVQVKKILRYVEEQKPAELPRPSHNVINLTPSNPFGGNSFGGGANPFGGSTFGSSTNATSVFGGVGTNTGKPTSLVSTDSGSRLPFKTLVQSSSDLPPYKCVWRLINFIYFFSEESPLNQTKESTTTAFYQILASILDKVTLSISPSPKKVIKRLSKLDNSDIQNSIKIEDIPEVQAEKLYRSKFVISQLDLITGREFFAMMIPTLFGEGSPDTSHLRFQLFVSIASALMLVYPAHQQLIILYVTLSPYAVIQRLWNTLTEQPFYSTIFDSPPTVRVLNSVVGEDQTFLKVFSFFLDIYSYWLIVANDSEFHESRTTQGLSLEDVKSLARFLRNLGFTLLWNGVEIESDPVLHRIFNESIAKNGSDKSSGAVTTSGSTLGKNTIMVMRQIYARDSRRQFLPDDFWLMTTNFQINNFISAVVQEEEQLRLISLEENDKNDNEVSDDSEDEDGDSHIRHTFDKTRSLGGVAPRLETLRQAPFFIPFDVRLRIFQEFILNLKREEEANTPLNIFGLEPRQAGLIRRDHLLEDAFSAFNDLGTNFRQPISVRFSGEFGIEAGIGPGITKEFLTVVSKTAFIPTDDEEYHIDTKEGLFVSNNEHFLFPNPKLGVSGKYSEISREDRIDANRYMNFLGKIIGKCIYENILVNVDFAPFFLQKWQQAGIGYRSSFDDLYSLDPELYENLIKLYEYTGNVESDLALDFTITQDTGNGTQKTIELRPNGANIPVTNSNRLEYIHAVAHYKLNTVLHSQTSLFLQGLFQLIPPRWLSMFNPRELQMLISGKPADIDIEDIKKHTVLAGYEEDDSTIGFFWEVLEEMSEDDKQKFIKFVTSVPKAPLLGFSSLNPLFAIRFAGTDTQRLPTASTCINLLKLPRYRTKEELRRKLEDAIRADAGFELS